MNDATHESLTGHVCVSNDVLDEAINGGTYSRSDVQSMAYELRMRRLEDAILVGFGLFLFTLGFAYGYAFRRDGEPLREFQQLAAQERALRRRRTAGWSGDRPDGGDAA